MELELDPATYARLRSVASRILEGDATVDPEALVHEAWERLARRETAFTDERHVFRAAAQAMRHVVIDRIRAENTQRRGGDARRTTLSGIADDQAELVDLLHVHRLIELLTDEKPEAAEVLLLRTFGGLTTEETAESMGVSTGTVKRHWRFALAFLRMTDGLVRP